MNYEKIDNLTFCSMLGVLQGGIKVLEEFLFEGTQIQRNYCTLYFARKDEWALVNKAFKLGLIDSKQAYSR